NLEKRPRVAHIDLIDGGTANGIASDKERPLGGFRSIAVERGGGAGGDVLLIAGGKISENGELIVVGEAAQEFVVDLEARGEDSAQREGVGAVHDAVPAVAATVRRILD